MLLYLTHTPTSRKVKAVVNSLKFDIEIKYLDLLKGEQKNPDYLLHNPNGTVPTLVDGDFNLWESNAIMQYLCDTTQGGDTLFPGDIITRSDIVRWQFWEMAHFNRTTQVFVWENFVKPTFDMGKTNFDLVEVATGDFHKYATTLDNHLKNKQFLVGEKLSLADYSVANVAALYALAKVPVESYRNINDWIARLDAIPAWIESAPPMRGH